MKHYKHVVVGLELNPEADDLIIKKAQNLATSSKAALTLIHAVEHFSNYGVAYGVFPGDIEQALVDEANKAMADAGKRHSVDAKHQLIKIGPAKQVILDEAREINADLIVVGSHGRHGPRLLLGSTANAVLHGAECDVMAVRISDD